MQLQIHAQNMADAAGQRQSDAIAMVEETHQKKKTFDDGGATLALMGRDTSPAVELMQLVIEAQRTTYPHDGSDLILPLLLHQDLSRLTILP